MVSVKLPASNLTLEKLPPNTIKVQEEIIVKGITNRGEVTFLSQPNSNYLLLVDE